MNFESTICMQNTQHAASQLLQASFQSNKNARRQEIKKLDGKSIREIKNTPPPPLPAMRENTRKVEFYRVPRDFFARQ